MQVLKRTALGVALAAALGATAVAAPTQNMGKKTNAGDKMICKDIEQIGSRLASRRVCLTAQQWRNAQNDDRDQLERSQKLRTRPDAN